MNKIKNPGGYRGGKQTNKQHANYTRDPIGATIAHGPRHISEYLGNLAKLYGIPEQAESDSETGGAA